MGKYGGFKSEKRKKENARLKKQEEKRQRRFGLKTTEDSEEQGEIIEGQESPEEQQITGEQEIVKGEEAIKASS